MRVNQMMTLSFFAALSFLLPFVPKDTTREFDTAERVIRQIAITSPKTAGYVRQNYQTAIEEQRLFGIPASVTLGQAIMEGGIDSRLIREANNHFGVKYHNRKSIPEGLQPFVTGYIEAHDDCVREHRKDANGAIKCPKPDKFVSYSGRWASYRHHSYVLQNRRYTKYNPKTYNDWCYALKHDRGGYFTDRRGHVTLLRLIKKYKLFEFDTIARI